MDIPLPMVFSRLKSPKIRYFHSDWKVAKWPLEGIPEVEMWIFHLKRCFPGRNHQNPQIKSGLESCQMTPRRYIGCQICILHLKRCFPGRNPSKSPNLSEVEIWIFYLKRCFPGRNPSKSPNLSEVEMWIIYLKRFFSRSKSPNSIWIGKFSNDP